MITCVNEEKVEKEMRAVFMIIVATMLVACGDENLECKTEIECTEDKESICEPPSVREFPNGEFVEVRACVYATYEHCFEKTVCKEVE